MKSCLPLILAFTMNFIAWNTVIAQSINSRADTTWKAASEAHNQKRYADASLHYQDFIALAGETPRALRSVAQCLWSAYPQRLDSLRKAQEFMQRYSAKGGKESSAQGISRNIELAIATAIQDSIRAAQALLAAAERRRLDSLARWRQDSLDQYWSARKERLQYLGLRRGATYNVIASGGIYLPRTATNLLSSTSYSTFLPFGELSLDARFAHWFTDYQTSDGGLLVDYGVGFYQGNVNIFSLQTFENYDIGVLASFWANLRLSIGDIGFGTIQAMASYRHEWGIYYNLPPELSADTNARLIVNMLGGGMSIEPALGRYGMIASVRYFPQQFSFGKTANTCTADAWNMVVGYQFPKFGMTLEAWLTQRTHTGLVPNFAHNTFRLRFFFEWYQVGEYKWF